VVRGARELGCAVARRLGWLSPVLLLVACEQGGRPLPERAPATPLSGYAFQSPEEQALQDDAFANPGLLWVDRGEALFAAAPAEGSVACADCHEATAEPFRTVAARLPAWDPARAELMNLESRINACRVDRQGQPALAYESEALLSLAAYIARQARGTPIEVTVAAPARASFDAAREHFYERRGQLNLACYHCHEQNVGRMLRGDRLSQGQATGYPAYKLEWQALGSLQRRLRDCHLGVRAEAFPYGDARYLALELFLAWRARGLPLETPAVRR